MVFEKIFYINLKKDIERRQNIESLLDRYFPSVEKERIEAIDADRLVEYRDVFHSRLHKNLVDLEGNCIRPGVVGCYLSHYIVREKISADAHPGSYLVVEDDCIFGDKFVRFVEDVDPFLPEDWHILKPVYGKYDIAHKINLHLFDVTKAQGMPWDWYWGTHVLIYNQVYIDQVSRALSKLEVDNIDYLIDKNLPHVYAFGEDDPEWCTQSNLNGSNTYPDLLPGANSGSLVKLK